MSSATATMIPIRLGVERTPPLMPATAASKTCEEFLCEAVDVSARTEEALAVNGAPVTLATVNNVEDIGLAGVVAEPVASGFRVGIAETVGMNDDVDISSSLEELLVAVGGLEPLIETLGTPDCES